MMFIFQNVLDLLRKSRDTEEDFEDDEMDSYGTPDSMPEYSRHSRQSSGETPKSPADGLTCGKRLSFNNQVSVVLVPSIKDYKEAGCDLWLTHADYHRYRNAYASELEAVAKAGVDKDVSSSKSRGTDILSPRQDTEDSITIIPFGNLKDKPIHLQHTIIDSATVDADGANCIDNVSAGATSINDNKNDSLEPTADDSTTNQAQKHPPRGSGTETTPEQPSQTHPAGLGNSVNVRSASSSTATTSGKRQESNVFGSAYVKLIDSTVAAEPI
jgi:hypothetical protein